MTVKESAINVPQNLDARRRITFFANSLFMTMPTAPRVRDMLSFRLVLEHNFEEISSNVFVLVFTSNNYALHQFCTTFSSSSQASVISMHALVDFSGY